LHLILHLPAAESAELDWSLSDRQGAPLRQGRDALADVPRAERVTAVIPANHVLFTELKLPPVSAARLQTLLPFAIEDKLMSDPASIVALAGGANANGERVVAVVDKPWLMRALSQLVEAGFRPDSVIPASELVPREAGHWTAVLPPAQHDRRDGFVVREDGFALAFDVSATGEAPFALVLAVKEAGDRAPRAFTALSSHESDVTAWPEQLGRPVHWRAPAARVPAASPFDFLNHPALRIFARRSDWQSAWPAFKPAALLAATLAVVYLGSLAWEVWQLERQQHALRQDMTTLFQSAFPEARAIVDPALQMARNLEQLKRDRGLANDPAVPALARMTEWLKASPGVKVESLRFDGKVVTADVSFTTPPAAPTGGLRFTAQPGGKRGTLSMEVTP